MKSFWNKKPLNKNNKNEYNIIFNKELLKQSVENELRESNIVMDYRIINEIEENHVEFINKNYNGLYYTKELVEFFCGERWIGIEFYPKGKTKLVGFVISSVKGLSISFRNNRIIQDTLEVNFLSLDKALRNMNVSNYMISIITKESINEFGIITAIYTVGKRLNTSTFSNKLYYHMVTEEHDTKYSIEYKNGSIERDWVNDDKTSKLYKYEKSKYKIFEVKTESVMDRISKNRAFHQFYIRETDEYVCIYRLDNINKTSIGYIYSYYIKENTKYKLLEKLSDYCKRNGIFEEIIISDSMGVDTGISIILGSGILYYYFYNVDISTINHTENGLTTI
jgi:hypothetical protein